LKADGKGGGGGGEGQYDGKAMGRGLIRALGTLLFRVARAAPEERATWDVKNWKSFA